MMSPEQKYAREHQVQHDQLLSPARSQPDGQAILQEMQGQQAKVHQQMEEAEHRMEEAEHLLQEAAHQVEDAAHRVHEAEHQVHAAEHRVHEAEHQVHAAEHEVREAEHEMQLVDEQIQEAVQQRAQPEAESPSLDEEAQYHHRPCRSLHDSESVSVKDCLTFERFRTPWRGSPGVAGSAENVAAAGFVAPRSAPLGPDMADHPVPAAPPPPDCAAPPADPFTQLPDGEGGKGEEDDDEEESAYDHLRKTKNTHTPLW